MSPQGSLVATLLLAFPALFSIVNPIGAALIFSQVTADRTVAERRRLARLVGLYSLAVLLVSLWAGSYVLRFFGISLEALRLAGGLVVASRAWSLLNAPEVTQARRQAHASRAPLAEDAAFFPLTMPFTTGPGTIAVAVALGSVRMPGHAAGFFAGVTLAALGIALSVWVAYVNADRLLARLGPSGARSLTRLVAFLLLCIGVQIMLTGATSVLRQVVHP